jgi:hypothetical protein
MARRIDITVAPQDRDKLIADIKTLDNVINLQLLQGVSISPPGDVVSVTIPSKSLQELMRLLDQHGLGTKAGFSVTSSEPDSLVDANHSQQLDRDWIEASWEEMETIISKGSNANSMLLILVATAGVLAAVGIATNAIHVAIGGMLVAPGFMPLMRITLGFVCGCKMIWKKGVADVFLIYAVMIVAAALTALLLKAFGMDPLPGKADYYQLTKSLFSYWTTVTPVSIISSAAASLAGAVLIATKRSVFTSGVMIGLALVPSASIVGMALVTGDIAGAGNAALRWLTDVVLILGISYAFFMLIKQLRHKRNIAIS